MKKLLLLSLTALGMGVNTFAQVSSRIDAVNIDATTKIGTSLAAGRTTAVGDTFKITYMNLAAGYDTITTYYYGSDAIYDSGLAFGMNALGHKAWAERFAVVGTDSTMAVLGVVALFNGTYQPTSSLNVNFKVWSQGAKTTWLRPTLFNSGFPNTVLATKTVSVKNLGIGTTTTVPDTIQSYWFSPATGNLASNFFVGYDVSYTWGPTMNGDTIGLKSTLKGERHVATAVAVSASDTTVINQNVTMYNDGTWHDNFQQGFNIANHLYIYPIVKIGPKVVNSVSGIQKNNLTFYGNYPNPAVSSTNVKFSLAKSTDVTIAVLDINGKVVSTTNNTNLPAGEHTVSLETANLAAGNYIYVIRTADGDGMASQLTVAK